MTAMNEASLCGRNTPNTLKMLQLGKCLVNKEKALKIAFFFFSSKSLWFLQIFFKTVSKAPRSFFLSEYLLSS